jgi:hypothetical protein
VRAVNIAFRNGDPALVQPGLRSLNGSDYTLLTISQWAPAANATVTFETTVVNKTCSSSSRKSAHKSTL